MKVLISVEAINWIARSYNVYVLQMITLFTVVHALETDIPAETNNVLSKYISTIPDIKNKYIIDHGLSKVLSKLFKGKISTLPLYKINVTINRNPVKIPWTLSDPRLEIRGNDAENIRERQYKYEPVGTDQFV